MLVEGTPSGTAVGLTWQGSLELFLRVLWHPQEATLVVLLTLCDGCRDKARAYLSLVFLMQGLTDKASFIPDPLPPVEQIYCIVCRAISVKEQGAPVCRMHYTVEGTGRGTRRS